MMKKKYATLIITVVVAGTVAVVSGFSREKNVDYEKLFAYKPYTPANEVVKGNQTAINTIEAFLGEKVKTKNDGLISAMVSYPKYDNSKNVYNVFEVYDYNAENYDILYLFRDDTAIIQATQSTELYSDVNDVLNTKYQTNEYNYSNGAFGYKQDGHSYGIFNSISGYNCSSIWGYNSKSGEVEMVWCDYENQVWS